MIIKKRVFQFLTILSAITLINFFQVDIAESASSKQVVIDQNLKPGMALKDAIQLLGPPDKMNISDTETVIMPYGELGLSLELKSNGTLIEVIHLQSTFKGRFASGLEMGADFQRILSLYKQPDIMTKEIIEYSDTGRIFKLSEGKLVGADLYSGEISFFQPISKGVARRSEPVAEEVRVEVPGEVSEEVRQEIREAVREEVRSEVIEELRKEARQEVREEVREGAYKELSEDVDVFELYGFKVKQTQRRVIVKEITPGSFAESGGLKVGEVVRRAFYEGERRMNIYSVKGLEKILRRAINKYKETINILQENNYYYKVEVPKVY